MKIISKRGRKSQRQVEINEVEVIPTSSGGVIIIDSTSTMTQEEIDRAVESLRDLWEQLDELDQVIREGWYDLP